MISIVVPVYQSEKTLDRCVESLRNQTVQEIEVILVDDGSPDGCPALCDYYAGQDARLKVIHKKNGGVSSARNAGIDAATGTYVVFVDSDDYVEPNYCEAMLHAFPESGKGMVLCGYHHHYVGADVEKYPKQQDDLVELYRTGFLNMPWNKLFLREDLSRFPENLDLGEDLLFNLAYLKKGGRVSLVSEPLYHYIQDENGKTLSSRKRDNKLELAKMIRNEADSFFRACVGEKESQRIRQVVDTRFLCECLDEVEHLPFEKDMSVSAKHAVIQRLIKDQEVKEALRGGNPGPLDYQILAWCMAHRMVCVTYLLSVLRSFLVRWKRRGNHS